MEVAHGLGMRLYKYIIFIEKSVPVGGAFLPNACSLAPPKKAQLRAPLSPFQTAWTGFDPNMYSGGSSSAGPALVEIATARSFILAKAYANHPWSVTEPEAVGALRHCAFTVNPHRPDRLKMTHRYIN